MIETESCERIELNYADENEYEQSNKTIKSNRNTIADILNDWLY